MSMDERELENHAWASFRDESEAIGDAPPESIDVHLLRGSSSGARCVARRLLVKCGLPAQYASDGISRRHKQRLRRVYYQLVARGYLIPSDGPDENFTFSQQGLQFFKGEVGLEHPGALIAALEGLQKRNADAVDDASIVLLGEAHHCWIQSCHRAATILIGLASEEALVGLLNDLDTYPEKDPNGPFKKQWKSVKNTNQLFNRRWQPGLELLRELAPQLKKVVTNQDHKDLWDRSVGPLDAMAETVRCFRNKGAHDKNSQFRRTDVGLLLATMPTLLEHAADLREFLANLPPGLTAPKV